MRVFVVVVSVLLSIAPALAQGVVKAAKEDSVTIDWSGEHPEVGDVLQVREGRFVVGVVRVESVEDERLDSTLIDEIAPGVVRKTLVVESTGLSGDGVLVWASQGRQIASGAEVVLLPALLPQSDEDLELRLDLASGDAIHATVAAGCSQAVSLHSLLTLDDYDALRPMTIPLAFADGSKRVRPSAVPLDHPDCIRRRVVLPDGVAVWLPGGGVEAPQAEGGRRPSATVPPGRWSAVLQVWVDAEGRVKGLHGIAGSADWVREAAERWARSARWTPAQLDGEAVNCLLTLRFELEGRHPGR